LLRRASKDTVARLLIVDGQQRLTSLFAVMTGREVRREDYSYSRIRIGFRPTDATFTVTDAAVERDPEFIPDVSVLWESDGGRRRAVRNYLKVLAEKRGGLAQDEEDRLEDAIDRLYDLRNYPFKVVELSSAVDEEQVAEVFVRINSEGVTLNQADFILTLMSVFWEKGRQQLEEFSRACKTPSLSGASPFNWYIQPPPHSSCESQSPSPFAAPCCAWRTPCSAGRTSKPAGSTPAAAMTSSRGSKPRRSGSST
jgi:hypothetical protein